MQYQNVDPFDLINTAYFIFYYLFLTVWSELQKSLLELDGNQDLLNSHKICTCFFILQIEQINSVC